MIDIEAKRFNERLKALSSPLGNGGLAVAAAAIARWLGRGLDAPTLVWAAMPLS